MLISTGDKNEEPKTFEQFDFDGGIRSPAGNGLLSQLNGQANEKREGILKGNTQQDGRDGREYEDENDIGGYNEENVAIGSVLNGDENNNILTTNLLTGNIGKNAIDADYGPNYNSDEDQLGKISKDQVRTFEQFDLDGKEHDNKQIDTQGFRLGHAGEEIPPDIARDREATNLAGFGTIAKNDIEGRESIDGTKILSINDSVEKEHKSVKQESNQEEFRYLPDNSETDGHLLAPSFGNYSTTLNSTVFGAEHSPQIRIDYDGGEHYNHYSAHSKEQLNYHTESADFEQRKHVNDYDEKNKAFESDRFGWHNKVLRLLIKPSRLRYGTRIVNIPFGDESDDEINQRNKAQNTMTGNNIGEKTSKSDQTNQLRTKNGESEESLISSSNKHGEIIGSIKKAFDLNYSSSNNNDAILIELHKILEELKSLHNDKYYQAHEWIGKHEDQIANAKKRANFDQSTENGSVYGNSKQNKNRGVLKDLSSEEDGKTRTFHGTRYKNIMPNQNQNNDDFDESGSSIEKSEGRKRRFSPDLIHILPLPIGYFNQPLRSNNREGKAFNIGNEYDLLKQIYKSEIDPSTSQGLGVKFNNWIHIFIFCSDFPTKWIKRHINESK